MLESSVPMLATLFQMQRLIIICDFDKTTLDLRRQFFRGNQTLRVAGSLNHIDNSVLAESNLIVCAKNIGRAASDVILSDEVAVDYPWVILHNNVEKQFLFPSVINQQIYFYNEESTSLYEMYIVNSVVVQRQLSNQIPIDNIYNRRADLQGVTLKVVGKAFPPYYGINKTEAWTTLPSGDQVYPIKRGNTYGMIADVITVMGRELNFSVSRFARVDDSYGSYNIQSNESSGMIRSLFLQEVDLAVPLLITPDRFLVVDFLLPYHTLTFTLVTRRQDKERADWTLFVKPFSKYLWTTLALHSLVIVASLTLILWIYRENMSLTKIGRATETMKCYLMISASYLGRSYNEIPFDKRTSMKVVVFASSVVGIVIWMSYRASLASRLAVREFVLPFKSISELAENDDYKFLLGGGGSSSVLFHRFADAEQDSPENKLFKKHIAPDVESTTFDSDRAGLKHLLTIHNAALMINFESLLAIKNPCDFVIAWKSRQPEHEVILTQKKWPYKKILDAKLLKLRESGVQDSIRRSWEEDLPNCKVLSDDDSQALGPEKLIFIFTLLGVGYIVSVATFLFEMGKWLKYLGNPWTG